MSALAVCTNACDGDGDAEDDGSGSQQPIVKELPLEYAVEMNRLTQQYCCSFGG